MDSSLVILRLNLILSTRRYFALKHLHALPGLNVTTHFLLSYPFCTPVLEHQHRAQTLAKGRKILARRRLRSCLISWKQADVRDSSDLGEWGIDIEMFESMPHDLSTIGFEASTIYERGEVKVNKSISEGESSDSAAGEEDDRVLRQALEVEYMKVHDRLEQQSLMVVTRMFRAQLAAALDAFWMAISRQRRQRLVSLRAVRRLQVVLLVRAWDGLMVGLDQLKKQRAVILRAISRLASRKLAWSFDLLVNNVEISLERRHRLKGAVARWR